MLSPCDDDARTVAMARSAQFDMAKRSRMARSELSDASVARSRVPSDAGPRLCRVRCEDVLDAPVVRVDDELEEFWLSRDQFLEVVELAEPREVIARQADLVSLGVPRTGMPCGS